MEKLSRRQFLTRVGGYGIGTVAIVVGIPAVTGCATTPPAAAPTVAPPTAVPAAQPPQAAPTTLPATQPTQKTGNLLNQIPALSNQYWEYFNAGAQQAASALGISYTVQSFEGSTDKQLSQVENAASLKVNMLLSCAVDSAATRKVFSTAAKEKIFVASEHSNAAWSTPEDPEYDGYYATFVVPENVTTAKAMAMSVFNQLGGKGNVIHLSGLAGDTSSDERTLGVDAALKEFPNIKLVERQNGGLDRTAAQPVIENLLTAHPDVNAVVCHNDEGAIATLNALRDRNMKDVKVGGYDATPEFLNAMLSGNQAVASASIHPGWMGGFAVVAAFDAFNGVKLDPVEHMVYMDALIVDTREAAKAFEDTIYNPKTLPFDWRGMSRFLNPDKWDLQNGLKPIDPTDNNERTKQAKPAGFTGFPKSLQDSIAAGNLNKYAGVFADHFKSGPILELAKVTTSKKTVLGFGG